MNFMSPYLEKVEIITHTCIIVMMIIIIIIVIIIVQ